MQQTPVVSPFYLPQIYGVLIKNCEKYPELLSHVVRQRWEQDFLAIIGILGVAPKFGSNGPYWPAGLSKSLSEQATGISIDFVDIVQKFDTMRALFNVSAERARFDQNVIVPAEAIGFLEFRGNEKKFKIGHPSDFFSQLIQKPGAEAAVLLLAHLLRIRTSSILDVKVTPTELLAGSIGRITERENFVNPQEGGANGSLRTYALGIYSNALYPWIENVFPSDKDQIPDEIKNLVSKAKKLSQAGNESIRTNLPDPRFVALGIEATTTMINKSEISPERKATLLEAIGGSAASSRLRSSPESRVLNLIFVGPPGTGKSRILNYLAADTVANKPVSISNLQQYTLRSDQVSLDDDNIFKVQFHPSYGYEDFVEGIRPVSNLANPGSIRYAVVPGPLKVASDLAKAFNPIATKNERAIKIVAFISDGPEEGSKYLKIPDEYSLYSFDKRSGAFHILNAANEFVPIVDCQQLDKPIKILNSKEYHTVFWLPNIDVSTNFESHFVLLIDELNRGQPGKIFGEVLSLVESSKRLGCKEQLSIILPSSKEKFSLPPNLHLFCTMNQADRSLSSLDQAFRRRFKFIYLKPSFDLISDPAKFKKVTGMPDLEVDVPVNLQIANHFVCINLALADIGVSADNFIGHSYAFSLLEQYYSANRDENALLDLLKDLWRNDLHSTLKDLISGRIDDFADAFTRHSDQKNAYKLSSKDLNKFLTEDAPGDIPWAA